MIKRTFVCPQCGCESNEIHEGYCADCCKDNQRSLDDHNFQFDYWNSLSDRQKQTAIEDQS